MKVGTRKERGATAGWERQLQTQDLQARMAAKEKHETEDPFQWENVSAGNEWFEQLSLCRMPLFAKPRFNRN